jgi:hypothetical protein
MLLGGFGRVRRWLEATRPVAPGGADPPTPRAVRRAVLRASRTVPGTTCLPMSAVAFRLLRRAGCEAQFTIGVLRQAPEGGTIRAHAWVASGDFVVIGDTDGIEIAAYAPLTTFGAG